MMYLLVILSIFLSPKDSLILQTTSIQANNCKLAGENIIYTYNGQINISDIKNFQVKYSSILNSIALDLDSYNGLINAVLLNNGLVKIYDNKLSLIYSLDLSQFGISSPSLIAIWSASLIYVFDNFSQKLYLIDFINQKNNKTIQLPPDLTPIDIENNGKNLFVLTDQSLYELNPILQLDKIISTPQAKSLNINSLGIWILLDKKVIQLNSKIPKTYFICGNTTKICGLSLRKLYMINDSNRLVFVRLP